MKLVAECPGCKQVFVNREVDESSDELEEPEKAIILAQQIINESIIGPDDLVAIFGALEYYRRKRGEINEDIKNLIDSDNLEDVKHFLFDNKDRNSTETYTYFEDDSLIECNNCGEKYNIRTVNYYTEQ